MAFAEKQQLTVTHFEFEQRIVIIHFIEPVEAGTVDFAAADENIFALISYNQVAAVGFFIDAGIIMRTELCIVTLFLIAAGE